MLQLVKPQQANDADLEITRLEDVRGELVRIAMERNLNGEAKQAFSSTIDFLTSFINEGIELKRPGDFCLLCGEAPSIIGVFIPQDPVAWGSRKGKSRFFRYCLCEKCRERSDIQDAVEKVIRVEVGGVSHAE